MKIYCVCLPSRLNHCKKFFQALKPPCAVEYVEACLAEDIPEYPMQMLNVRTTRYAFVEPDYRAKKTKLACSISHRNVLQTFLESDDDLCIIVEDDNEVPDEKEVRMFYYWYDWLQANSDKFNLVNLSPCLSKCPMMPSLLHPNLYRVSGYCMNCYCVTRAGAIELLSKTLTVENHTLDMFLPALTRSYELHPRLFEQNTEASSLSNPPSPMEYMEEYLLSSEYLAAHPPESKSGPSKTAIGLIIGISAAVCAAAFVVWRSRLRMAE